MKPIYLDWAATAPVDLESINEIDKITYEFYANPSSAHKLGKIAKKQLEIYRKDISDLLGCLKNEIYFTSGGSESNSIVLLSSLLKKRKGSVLISNIEHPSVYNYKVLLESFGHKPIIIPANKEGFITSESVIHALEPDTHMVCIMAVNNETGAVQPIEKISTAIQTYMKSTHKYNDTENKITLHCDAVQSLGKIHFSLQHVDTASFSGHKIGTPKGIGLLYIKNQCIKPILRGGDQEGLFRPGTENTGAAAGIAKALDKRFTDLDKINRYLYDLKNLFITSVTKIEGVKTVPHNLNPTDKRYSPYITMITTPIPGEVVVRIMSDKGFFISTGSACSSKKKKKNRIIEGMDITEKEALGVLRISMGWTTKKKDIIEFCKILKDEIEQWQL